MTYVEARNIMKDDLTTNRNILNIQSKNKRKLEINDILLLTPQSYSNSNTISKKEDICIEEEKVGFEWQIAIYNNNIR